MDDLNIYNVRFCTQCGHKILMRFDQIAIYDAVLVDSRSLEIELTVYCRIFFSCNNHAQANNIKSKP